MSYWLERLDSIIEERVKEKTPITIESISNITLTKFSSRNMAALIYSEVLDCNIWFCSNESMAAQVKQDDPSSICYTVEELRPQTEP